MGNFVFRLEKVLRHRKSLVDQHSLELARIQRQLSQLSQRVVTLDGEIHRQSCAMVCVGGQKLNSQDLTAATTWMNHLHQLKEQLDQQLLSTVKDLDHRRSRLENAWRDLEILTRLKSRQANDWQAGQDKQERRDLDEIGQIRAFRPRVTKDSS